MDMKTSESTSDPPPESLPSTNGDSQFLGSRKRFEHYRQKVKAKELPQGGFHSAADLRTSKPRGRSATRLVWQFFQLLAPYRWQIFGVLLSLTIATVIGLIPPAGTKFIIDYGLSGRPLR